MGASLTVRKATYSNYSLGKTIPNFDSSMAMGLSNNRGYEPSRAGNGFVYLLDKWMHAEKIPVDLDGIYMFFLAPDVKIIDYTPDQVLAYNLTQENYCG